MAISVGFILLVVSIIVLTLAFVAGRYLVRRIMAPDIDVELIEEPRTDEPVGRGAV